MTKVKEAARVMREDERHHVVAEDAVTIHEDDVRADGD